MTDYNSLESLFHLVHALKRQLHHKTEQLELGITPMHIRVIKIIAKQKPCTAIDIVNFLGRDKAQVTRLINTLIDKHLINKEPNPNDKRSHYLSTTTAGDTIIEAIKTIDQQIIQMMNQNLKPEEIVVFQKVSRLMAQNLITNPY